MVCKQAHKIDLHTDFYTCRSTEMLRLEFPSIEYLVLYFAEGLGPLLDRSVYMVTLRNMTTTI